MSLAFCPILCKGKTPFKLFMSYRGIFIVCEQGETRRTNNGACSIALGVPAVQNSTHRLKTQF